LVFVLETKTKRKKDLTLSIHPAVHTILHGIDGPPRKLGFPRELELGHGYALSDLLDSV